MIKAIRAATLLDLRNAKHLADLADRTPTPLGSFSEEIATRLQNELLAAGCAITINTDSQTRSAGPLAELGQLVLFPDRVVSPEGTHYDLTAYTNASVEVAGGTTVTRGRNLAAKAAGGLLMPGGVFLFGNAREHVRDNRELFIVIEDPDWHYVIAVHPDLGLQARDFAAALRSAAAALAAPGEQTNDQQDVISQLQRLADLRDRGALSDAEFESQKQRILNAQ